MNRGNARKVIYRSDRDCERFLEQLKDNLETYDVRLYAFVLMKNHYHLLVRTEQANLSRFVQRLNTSYALYFRYKHNAPGHVFQGRFKAKIVEDDEYAHRLIRYIHLNPVKMEKQKPLSRGEKIEWLEKYPWTSYHGYVQAKKALDWIDYSLLKTYGRNWAEARRKYKAYALAMVHENDDEFLEALQASAYAIGDEDFVQEMEEKLKDRRKGDDRDRDIIWPASGMSLESIDRFIAEKYGIDAALLKDHGHRAGEAKTAAIEMSVRYSGKSMREIGAHYGNMTSSSVSMVRKKVRDGDAGFQKRIDELARKLDVV